MPNLISAKRLGAILALAGLVAFAGTVQSAITQSREVRLTPISASLYRTASVPAEVREQERDSVPAAFDLSTESELVLYDSGEVAVEFSGRQGIAGIRFHAPAPYVLSVFEAVGKDKWRVIEGLVDIDLSTGDGWRSVSADEVVSTASLKLALTPSGNGRGFGLAELEFWGPGETAAVVDGASALQILGNRSEAAQLRSVGADGGTISVAAGTTRLPVSIQLPHSPQNINRAWLVYELRGIDHWRGVTRSVNGLPARGGYYFRPQDEWSVQYEPISPDALVAGENTVEFSTLSGAASGYRLRNLRLVYSLDDGHQVLRSTIEGEGLTDGSHATGWAINAGNDELYTDLPVSRRSALDALALDIDGVPSGILAVEALRDSEWVQIFQQDLSTLAGGSNLVPIQGDSGDALRLRVTGERTQPFRIVEAGGSGSGLGAAHDPASLAISLPHAGEFFGRTAYIRGYLSPEANESGRAEIFAAGLPIETTGGEFEFAISKDQAGYSNQEDSEPWYIELSALYPDGSMVTRTVSLVQAQADDAYVASIADPLSILVEPGEEQTVVHADAELTVPADALEEAAEIQITPLTDIEMARLDTGLVNVTRGPRHGYRFLPHRNFQNRVKMKLPFDRNRIPLGYDESDVRVFYFDEAAGRWTALAENNIDEAKGEVTAQTDHFTDFIAGVVVAPESPQLANFNPTQIKDIKVGDPSTRINLISVPGGSQTGDARLDYPIELPAGRQGMTPQFQLSYNSGGGNGWIGMGWSLGLPEISVDTRWGVPRYTRSLESETYQLSGQQLTPVAHRGDLLPRTPDKRFHLRVEGSFDRIVRHGAAPDEYWWEVTDKNGVRSIYGGDAGTGAMDSGAVLADDSGNIYRWALTERIDPNGNRITYDYVKVAHTGLRQGSLEGRNIYPSAVNYTGHGASEGPFRITFIRDREQDAFSERRDVTIDARGGFKMVTADLLRRLEITYSGEPVRSYDLEYEEGAFYRQLLRTIVQNDAAGNPFNSHTFEYFDDSREDGRYRGFLEASDWNSPDDRISLSSYLDGDASAISGHEGTSSGGHLYVGFGLTNKKEYTIGPKIGVSRGGSEGRLSLVDIDGDGLPDKVFQRGSSISYRRNVSGPDGALSFSSDAVLMSTLPAILREKNGMTSTGIEAYFGATAGVNWSDSVTHSPVYFSDVNGDGLTDLVRNGTVLFNRISAAGVPTFDADSSITEYPLGPAAVDAAVVALDYDDLYQRMIDNAPLVDSVGRWVAPYPGRIEITAPVELIEDNSPERTAYETADGVIVAIEHNGVSLWSDEIAASDYARRNPSLDPLDVAKGDVVYFRVQSKFDGAYDQVSWSPQISYTNLASTLDANGLDVSNYSAGGDFAYAGLASASFTAPFDGTVRIGGRLIKSGITTDDVRVELLKNDTVIFTDMLARDATGSIDLSQTVQVRKLLVDSDGNLTRDADKIELRVDIDSRIDHGKLTWSEGDAHRAVYIASTDANLPEVNDEDGNPLVSIPLPAGGDTFPETDLNAPLAAWTANEDGLFQVTPQIVLMQGGASDMTIYATVKSGGELVAKQEIPVAGGVVQTTPFEFTAVSGSDYFFEFASDTPETAAMVSESAVELLSPTAVIGTADAAFHSASRPTILAQAYRGWTRFGYDGNRERAEVPISITDADLSAEPGDLAARQAELQAAIDAGIPDDELVNSYRAIVLPMTPDIGNRRWSGADENIWISAEAMSSSRQGADYIEVPETSVFAGGRGVPRISRTESRALMFGVLGASLTSSSSETVSELDFLDVNGDRFPDIVKQNRLVQFSPMIGGLEAAAVTVPNMRSDVRETEGESFGYGFGGNYPHQKGNSQGVQDTSATRANSGESGTQMASLGLSANITESSSDINYDLRDVNADGLPDLVRRAGNTLMVRFNLGYRFADVEEIYGAAQVNAGESKTTAFGGSIGFNDGTYAFGGGLNASSTKSDSLRSLADVNGDGLLDAVSKGNGAAIRVALNSGSGFETPIDWPTGGRNHGLAYSRQQTFGGGAYFSFGPCILGICVTINPGFDVGETMGRLETAIQDIDGDGYPDYLHSEDDDELTVARSSTGRTNLLKKINRPLGSTVEIAYARTGNSYDQPHSRWVMSRVEVFDGFAGDGDDFQISEFDYSDGFYDRQEREFYGFASVVERQIDRDAPGVESVYRVVTSTYLNGTYYEKGLLKRRVTADGAGALWLATENSYRFVDIATGTDVSDPESLTATVFPQLVRTDERFYEGQPTAGVATYQTFAYDEYGNVTRFFDAANLADAGDDVESVISWHEDIGAHILGKADHVAVTGNGRVMRERSATFQAGTGNLLQVTSFDADGTASVTDLTYDIYGNVASATGPANHKGQRYRLDYTHDSAVNTYVTRIADSFGHVSTASHDVRFGQALETVDVNGEPLRYSLDDAGRVVAVQGPYQAGTSLDTIRFEYHPLRDVAGDDRYPDVAVSHAITDHIDTYRNVSDPIRTVLFVDGLKRALQTKKDATVRENGQAVERMVASGRVSFDFLGRTTEQYYPVVEPLGQPGVFNASYDSVAPTLTDYDVLDRPVRVTIPDGSATLMQYGFGPDRDGATRFRTVFTDANSNSRETFADVRKLITSVMEKNPAGGQPQIWTSYAYDPLKQIVSVTDDHCNVTRAEYDNLGRMTGLDSPDMGLTRYSHDPASNLVAKQTAALADAGERIAYDYDFNRLASVAYPLNPGNDVSYEYGAPGAGYGRVNRIARVTSQAGSFERFYGPLGETVREVATIASDTQGNSPNSPEVYETNYVYDSWNRLQAMTFPDGEVLENAYDSGGRLASIDGAKGSYDYAYLRDLHYDKFGQRVYQRAGNGTVTEFAYVPTTRRLARLVAGNANNNGNGAKGTAPHTFQDLSYGYDLVGNIVTLSNAASVTSANQLGGATVSSFGYDDLYRLTAATGRWEYQPGKAESYTLALGYDSIHNITAKNQRHVAVQPSGNEIVQKKTSYDWTYGYGGPRPHAPTLIGERAFSYDANGNQSGWEHTQNGTRRNITWDEENRIQAVADNGHTVRYKYDDAGQRVIKRGPQGETAYVNQFFTIRNREVATKHVYAGSTRLVSKMVKMPVVMGDANTGASTNEPANGSTNGAGKQPWGWVNGNGGNGLGAAKHASGPDVYESDQYYFHPDHLGSSAYVTDIDGEIFQHLEYFPFGESFVEEQSNTQRTPYLFTAKELDEDTQLYYFGARYYDPRTSVWQSADPILGEYMGGAPAGGVHAPRNLSLFNYGGQNPVRVSDPEGQFLDTILDVGFVIYDLGALAYDEIANGGKNRTENLMALGADVAGAAVPFATGGGLAVRTGSKVVNKADDAAEIAAKGTKKVDEAVDAGKVSKSRFYRGKNRDAAINSNRNPDGSLECAYCGKKLSETPGKPNTVAVDHVKAHSKGGPTSIENSATACKSCNSSKGNKELGSEWIPPISRE